MGSEPGHNSNSSTSSRGEKCTGRPTESRLRQSPGMATRPRGGTDHIQLPQTAGRPVCLEAQPPTSNILLQASRRPGLESGQSSPELGQYIWIRLPSNITDSSGFGEDREVPMLCHPRHPSVASSTWVPETVRTGGGAPPVLLPHKADLLTQRRGRLRHPDPGMFSLAAWKLSVEKSLRKVFLQRLSTPSRHQTQKGLKQLTNAGGKSSVVVSTFCWLHQ